MNELNNILIKIREVKPEFQKDEALAKALGISAGAFANHKQRGSIPYKHIVNFCNNYKIDINSIFIKSTGVDNPVASSDQTGRDTEEMENLKDDLILQLKLNQKLQGDIIERDQLISSLQAELLGKPKPSTRKAI